MLDGLGSGWLASFHPQFEDGSIHRQNTPAHSPILNSKMVLCSVNSSPLEHPGWTSLDLDGAAGFGA